MNTTTLTAVRRAELANYRDGSPRPTTRSLERRNPYALTPQEQVELLEQQSADAFYPQF